MEGQIFPWLDESSPERLGTLWSRSLSANRPDRTMAFSVHTMDIPPFRNVDARIPTRGIPSIKPSRIANSDVQMFDRAISGARAGSGVTFLSSCRTYPRSPIVLKVGCLAQGGGPSHGSPAGHANG